MGDKEIGEILKGKRSIPLITGRHPTEQNMWGLFNAETRVISSRMEIFHKLPKGGVYLGLDALIGERADFDSDEAFMSLSNIRSVDEFNKVMADTRARKARFNEAKMTFQSILLENPSIGTEEALQAAQIRLKHEYSRSELSQAHEHITTVLKDGLKLTQTNIMQDGIPHNGYTYKYLEKYEQRKVAKMSILEATLEDLKLLTRPADMANHLAMFETRAQQKIIGAMGVGVVSSASTLFKTRSRLAIDYLKHFKGEQGVFDTMQELGFMPGSLDFKNPNRHAIFQDFIEKKFGDIESTVSSLIEQFTSGGPAQQLVSTKKLNKPGSLGHMWNLITGINNTDHPGTREAFNFLDIPTNHLDFLRGFDQIEKILKQRFPDYEIRLNEMKAPLMHQGRTVTDVLQMALRGRVDETMTQMTPDELQTFQRTLNDRIGFGFAERTSTAWRNSVKQTLFNKIPKSGLGLATGLGLLTFFNPNQLTGGVSDFGMSLGHTPGRKTESGVGNEVLDPKEGEDVFTEKWTHLLKDDPILSDNINKYSQKNYKDFLWNKRMPRTPDPTRMYKRNYIDRRKQYSKYYETNDMRRTKIPGF